LIHLKYSRNLDITVEESIRVDTFIVPALLNDEPRIFHGFLTAAIASAITSINNCCVSKTRTHWGTAGSQHYQRDVEPVPWL